jgi:8-oxo-dGTP diphosphatase
MKHSYEFPRPAVAADVVVFGYQDSELSLLLIERGLEPFKGMWALPGGFVRVEETLEEAAMRELAEEAGVKDVYLEQLYTFSSLQRDPRERVISVSYFALVKPSHYELAASTDATNAKWFPVAELPDLAFDHSEIVETALKRLQGKVRYEPLGFELLPASFTLTQLQSLYEAILRRSLDKRNFRKKILSLGILRELNKKIENVPHRSPSLYKFDSSAYRKMKKAGIQLEI